MKIIFIVYGITIIASWLLIRLGYSLDETVKYGDDDNNLTYWLKIMFVPIINLVFPVLAVSGLVSKKMDNSNILHKFLTHFFLSNKKIKKGD